jgi:hypothetical protein
MKSKVGFLAVLLVAASLSLSGCAKKKLDAIETRLTAMETMLAKTEANLVRVNELHGWVSDTLYPTYVLTHKKVWGARRAEGSGDPPAPPPPPPKWQ